MESQKYVVLVGNIFYWTGKGLTINPQKARRFSCRGGLARKWANYFSKWGKMESRVVREGYEE